MSEIAIRVEKLSKRYRIGALKERYYTFRDALSAGPSRLRSVFSRNNNSQEKDMVWALRDISFEVKQGEVVGIIGRNGAGKTTLLKVLTRITPPTEGRATIYGRVASLLEVGTGFHPELSGRENIYLNGAILGMGKREIERKFDEIVTFAEVEKFIDTPVKRYSSGMHVRLAFAVAAHLEPEILLVDEVLAVGDVAFQKKCLGKMGDVARQGRTVLLVSHTLPAIRSFAKRTIWIHDGKIKKYGETAKVISSYLETMLENSTYPPHREFLSNPHFEILDVVTKNTKGENTIQFSFGSDIIVEITFQAKQKIERPYLRIGLGEENTIISAQNMLDGLCPDHLEGEGKIACCFYRVTLLPRIYNIFFGIRDQNAASDIVASTCIGHFEIIGNAKELGLESEVADSVIKTCAAVVFSYKWTMPDGKEFTVRTKKGGIEITN